MANGKIVAGTYYNDFLPGGENDFIRYTEDINDMNEVLNSIDIPVLVVFGDADECVLTQPIDKVKAYLNNNIKNCNIEIINGADHSYCNKYEELVIIISKNFGKIFGYAFERTYFLGKLFEKKAYILCVHIEGRIVGDKKEG